MPQPAPTFPTIPIGSRDTIPMTYRRDWQMVVAIGGGVLLVLAGAALIVTVAVIL